MYANSKELKGLPDEFLREVQHVFVNYHNLEGKQYKLFGCKRKTTALDLIKKAQRPRERNLKAH